MAVHDANKGGRDNTCKVRCVEINDDVTVVGHPTIIFHANSTCTSG